MNSKKTEKILEYTVIFEPAEEGGYIASVPSIPGCMTQGETFEETIKNVKDAIVGCLEVLKEEGEKAPVENPHVIISKVSIANHSRLSIA
jgi:predicted RNase H-like HicB family nuclease